MTAKKNSSRTGACEVQYRDELSRGNEPAAVRSTMADRASTAPSKAVAGEGVAKAEMGLGLKVWICKIWEIPRKDWGGGGTYQIHGGAEDEDQVLVRDGGGRREEEVGCRQVKDG